MIEGSKKEWLDQSYGNSGVVVSKRRKTHVIIGEGARCPKCDSRMERRGHGDDWKPKEGQPYYFLYWDSCPRGHHIQLYESAKVLLLSEAENERLEAIKNQLSFG